MKQDTEMLLSALKQNIILSTFLLTVDFLQFSIAPSELFWGQTAASEHWRSAQISASQSMQLPPSLPSSLHTSPSLVSFGREIQC